MYKCRSYNMYIDYITNNDIKSSHFIYNLKM